MGFVVLRLFLRFVLHLFVFVCFFVSVIFGALCFRAFVHFVLFA